jgi:hypothetical protein
LTVQQRQLAKVVSLFIRFDNGLARRTILDGHSGTRLDEEELLTRFTLSNDVLAIAECTRLENIGDFGAFLRLERGKDGNFGEESLVQSSLS